MRTLHTHRFGPDDGPVLLAVHGLTGHGQRWQVLAERDLPEYRVIGVDLLGHGRSPSEPPWGIADHVAALAATVEREVAEADRPVVVVAHSFGSAVSLRLANHRPDLVKALVLLDPAQGLDPEFARDMARGAAAHRGYPDAAAAEAAKRAEGWSEVPDDIMADEIAEHLIPSDPVDNVDRLDWRVFMPAVITAWNELAGPALLPPKGLPTRVVVADRVRPPFVTPEFLRRCTTERADSVTVHHVDTEHMVPFLDPGIVARLVREVG